MTQEDKELLLKDLCARLPYGVKGIRDYADEVVTLHFIIPNCKCPNDKTGFIELEFTNLDCCPINEFKPYLRPMSSMTEEEKQECMGPAIEFELENLARETQEGEIEPSVYSLRPYKHIIDWLNAHHFDYRGLIEKGLALEAPEDMYKTE